MIWALLPEIKPMMIVHTALFISDDKWPPLVVWRGIHKRSEAGNQDAVSDPGRMWPALDPCTPSLAPQWAHVRRPSGPQQVGNCRQTRRGTSQGRGPDILQCCYISSILIYSAYTGWAIKPDWIDNFVTVTGKKACDQGRRQAWALGASAPLQTKS